MSCCSAFSSFSSLESSAFNSGPESSGRDVTSTYPRASIHRPLCKWSIFVSILSSKSIPMSFDTRKKNSVHIFLSVFIIVCVFHDEVVHTLISKISDKSQKVHVTPICIYIYTGHCLRTIRTRWRWPCKPIDSIWLIFILLFSFSLF
jgi:hypothetical protein